MVAKAGRVVYEFADFRFDAKAHRLLSGADEQPVPLTSRALDTLLYFIENRGELIEKTQLMKVIWPNAVVEENNLNQHICTLRRVLGERPGEHRFIVTVPGRGYRFVADVNTLILPPIASIPRLLNVQVDVTSAVAASPDRATRGAWTSIGVLPFENFGADRDKEYFSQGLADELINRLACVPGLRVPARTSCFAYRGRNIHVREIAQDLGVDTLLEGSIRSAGDRIRVTAQLVDARTGYHIWSHTYDRKFEDVFRLEDELVMAIVQEIDSQIGGANAVPPAVREA